MSQETEHTCATCVASAGSETRKPKRYKYRMAVLSASMLVLGLLLHFTGFNIAIIYAVFLLSMLSAGQFILPRGARGLAQLRLDMHFLMSVASIGAFIIGAPAEGAAVMFLFFISMLLEERAEDQVKKEIHELVELEPPSATIKMSKGAEALIPTSEVRVGDTLIIRPGTRIGLDGIVVCGQSYVNQAPITGESLPVSKSEGDKVYAGTINQEGYLEVEVTSEAHHTVLSRIVELVEEAKNKKAPTEQLISRFSRRYTPVMVTLTILLGVGSFLLGASITEATYRALTLLVISCPCAFVVSIPVSMVSSIAGSARDGVLVKGAIHIEQTSKTKSVAFDKTGTLTEGVLSVKDVCLHNDHSRDAVLTAAATLEQKSEHPIAKALVAATEAEAYQLPDAEGFSAIPGRGVGGQIGDTKYFVGNRRLLTEQNITLESIADHSCGVGTMVYVAQESEHLGTIVLADSLRYGATASVAP
ncbi:MAG: heavy metal translocating P-type ATPase, partial [Candidatus Thorarchaeota archaeon]